MRSTWWQNCSNRVWLRVGGNWKNVCACDSCWFPLNIYKQLNVSMLDQYPIHSTIQQRQTLPLLRRRNFISCAVLQSQLSYLHPLNALGRENGDSASLPPQAALSPYHTHTPDTHYTLKLSPHPHSPLIFGLTNVNSAARSVSL